MLKRVILRLAINLVPARETRRRLRERFFPKRRRIDISPSDRCLMVCPHPDDEMLGAGGVLVKHAANFDVCCISSAGVACGDVSAEERADIRIAEFGKVMDALGVRNRWIFKTFGKPPFIGQIDGMFGDYCAALDMAKYDYVFMPHPRDGHPEHQYITNVLMKRIMRRKGWRKNATVVFYEVWTPMEDVTWYEDISEVAERKFKVLGLYESQLGWTNYPARVDGLDKYRGMLGGNVEYAEAFNLVPVERYLRRGWF